MAGDAQAMRSLTLTVAVCEQAMLELAELKPPLEGELVAALERARDLATVELRMGRFAPNRTDPG
jgi:hypothetical protein